jgi:hypothetical protein
MTALPLFLFFEPTPASEAAGREFWQRRHQRTADVDLCVARLSGAVCAGSNPAGGAS